MPAGPRIRGNNVFGLTTDNPLSAVATSFNAAGLVNLPAVTSAHAIVVLDPLRVFGAPEIVVVTAHTALSTVATITRGAYGTVARSHPQGTMWMHTPVDEDYVEILTSGTRPSDPYRGQLIFETDTNSYVGRDTSDAWQTVVPLGAWGIWTPTITQAVNVTFTNVNCRFRRVGRIIFWNLNVTITGAGTAANTVLITLPVSTASTPNVIGHGWLFDASAGALFTATVDTNLVTDFGLRGMNATGLLGSAGFTAGLAAGDQIRAFGTFEAAS